MLFNTLALLVTASCSHPELIETAINSSAYDPSGQITDVIAYTGTVPTVIHVEWNLSAAATSWVEYRGPNQDEFKRTPTKKPGEQSTLATALLGNTEDADIEFRVVSLSPEGQSTTTTTATIHTPLLSQEMPRPAMAHSNPSIQAGFKYLMGSISNENSEWFIYVVNRHGKLVWSLPLADDRWGLTVKRSLDGEHILFNESPPWNQGDQVATVVRTSIDLSIWEIKKTPGQNHSFAEFNDGLIWSKPDQDSEDLMQHLVGHENEKLWDSSSWFEQQGLEQESASNAINWVAKDNSILFSLYDRHSIIHIDQETAEVKAVYGQLTGAYSFHPPNSIFSFQHHPTITQDGNLLLTSTPYPNEEGDETEVREYAINHDTQTLDLVWSYGTGRGLLAQQIGEARRLKNGNTLINYGTNTTVREVTNDGSLAWEILFDSAKSMGSTLPIEDLYSLCSSCR